MSDQVFDLPELGEGLTEAQIIEWKVGVGDTVSIDQIVVEVETAKALVEVPIPFAGRVVTLHGQPGDTIERDKPLITVAVADGSQPATVDQMASTPAPNDPVLIGFGATEVAFTRRRRNPKPATSAEAARQTQPITPAAQDARVISPVVRDLARRHNVDLKALSVSSGDGVIRRADVEQAIATAQRHDAAPDTSRQERRVAIKGVRKAVAEKMSISHREIPKATAWVDVDATGLVEARSVINAAADPEDKISLLALVSRLAIAALLQYPELNSAVDDERAEIIHYTHVNLGIATQTERGLIVPVIEQADTLNTLELSRELAATTALARDAKLPPAQLTGGTFTLNNYGVLGTDGAAPIINHPEVAMLGIGRIIDRPWVVEGELTVRKITQVAITFDHRVCDGGTSGGFLRQFADYIENPVVALGRL